MSDQDPSLDIENVNAYARQMQERAFAAEAEAEQWKRIGQQRNRMIVQAWEERDQYKEAMDTWRERAVMAEIENRRLEAEVEWLREDRDQYKEALDILEREHEALREEYERLEKLVEPEKWDWDEIDTIYEEARLLRKERDEARALLPADPEDG